MIQAPKFMAAETEGPDKLILPGGCPPSQHSLKVIVRLLSKEQNLLRVQKSKEKKNIMLLEAREDGFEHVQDVISLLSRVTWLFLESGSFLNRIYCC